MQSMAQQQCKNKERRLMRLFVCLHLTFLLQHIIVSPKHSPSLNRKNIQQDRIENAGIEFQLKVRNMYLHVSKLFQDRIVIIDGHEKASVINKKILDELFRRNIINEDII